MKKILLLTLIISICPSVFAQVNMPGEPSFGKPASTNSSSPSSYYKKGNTTTVNTQNAPTTTATQPQTTDSKKAALDSLAMSVLKAAEKRDNETMNKYIQKMMQNGAEGFSSPQIISKQTPHCPPIKIKVNGKSMSGSTCAMFGYLYKDKQYDVGYCK
ncbi:hypothetical protein IJ541_05015 [bacterium]|nr:hypothetical protein [bacterium]